MHSVSPRNLREKVSDQDGMDSQFLSDTKPGNNCWSSISGGSADLLVWPAGRKTNKMRRNWQSIFSWIVIATLASSITIVTYWLYYPIDVIDVHKVSFQGGEVFTQGETVALSIEYDKFLPLTADLAKYMTKLDEPNKGLVVTIIAASRPGHLPLGIGQKTVSSFIVPVTAPPGRYILTSTARYRVNPLRDFYESWTSPEFTVLQK